MKYADITKVAQLRDRLEELIEQRNRAESTTDSFLGITFQGSYQKPDLIDEIRPAIAAALTKRIIEVNERLKALGVEPDY